MLGCWIVPLLGFGKAVVYPYKITSWTLCSLHTCYDAKKIEKKKGRWLSSTFKNVEVRKLYNTDGAGSIWKSNLNHTLMLLINRSGMSIHTPTPTLLYSIIILQFYNSNNCKKNMDIKINNVIGLCRQQNPQEGRMLLEGQKCNC